MQARLGEPIPEDLAAALAADPEVLAMWGRLRPSCQRRHLAQVAGAKTPETRSRRVAAVIRLTVQWNERHAPPRRP